MAKSINPHILLFPYPAQGHMLSLLDLAENLANRSVSITILITPENLTFLNPLLLKASSSSSNLSIKPLILPFPSSPSIPHGIENTQNLPGDFFYPMMETLSALHDPLLNWFQTNPSPPTAIISDFLLGWTQNLANILQIPRIVFLPCSAFTYSMIRSLWLNMPQRGPDNSQNPNYPISFPEIPKSPTFLWYQISIVYRNYKKSDPRSEFIRGTMLANLSSWGNVFNTFDGLEGIYLDHMRNEGRVWAVGPLLPPEFLSDKVEETIERGGSSSVLASDLLEWLDLQENRSVVYVCFGSQAVLSNKQMEALAMGLAISGIGFIWCVKESPAGLKEGEFGIVPAGFEERTTNRGLVIRGWAPQVLVLKHGSVGAFLSHCGWNSVLESVVSGVPLLAWPMAADQFANARMVVEMGVGVGVCEGAQGVPQPNELARAIEKVVRADGLERARAVELKNSALSAVKDGGSSFNGLDGLISELKKL